MLDKRNALIIVDVQNDFCFGGALEVPHDTHIFARINRIAPFFFTVVATKDWHPPDHVSFVSVHPRKQLHDRISTPHGEQILWPSHCVQNTPGAELHPSLHIDTLSMILHKGTDRTRDSYSAFTEADGKTTTGLSGYMHERAVNSVYICGFATEFCVMATAIDAVRHDLRTTVVSDAVAGIDIPAGATAKACQTMRTHGIIFCTSEELIH